jgi:predicted deacylase
MSEPELLHFQSVSFTGLAPGARLIVLGAVHGNETCGTRAIRRVIAEIESGQLGIVAGRVTFVPVANPLAYVRGQRMGDRNLNRNLVPTDTPVEFEDRVANWLCPLLAQHDALLDLHSFHTAGEPFVMLGPEDNKGTLEPFARAAEETALALSLGVHRFVDGWLDTYAAGVARPTCTTAWARPSTCVRRAASRSPSNAVSTTTPPPPTWHGAPSTTRWRICG